MKIKDKKLWGKKGSISVSRGLKSNCLALAVFLLAFVFVPYVVSDVNAETTSVSVAWNPIALELNTSDVVFNSGANVTPTSPSSGYYGTLATVKSTIEVNTTGKYFNVFLSMDSDATTQNLCYVNPSNSDELLCDAGATAGISPIGATTSTGAASFTGTSWGFAVDDNDELGYGFSTSGYSAGVSMNNADAVYSTKFAAVPLAANAVKIWEDYSNNGFGEITIGTTTYTGTSDNTKDLYYGVMVGTDIISGTYKNNIVYTAIASASDIDEISTNILVNTVNASNTTYGNIGGPTDLVRLDMDLSADPSTSIDEDDITVSVYKHSDINSSTSLPNQSATAVGECDISSVAVSGATGGGLTVKCEMPGLDTSNNKFGLTSLENVDVDYIVEVATDNKTIKYSSYNNSGSGKFRYVGLQTRVGGNNNTSNAQHYVQSMQQMSAGICKMTNMWPNQVQHIGGTGSGYTGGNLNASVAVTKRWNDSDSGSYKLGDSRDGKAYLIRRLADGNCWMVQNLDLELYADVELSSSNTDLGYNSATKEYVAKTWSPQGGLGNDSAGDNIDNSDWESEKGYENVTLIGYDGSGNPTTIATCTGGTKDGPCYAKSTAAGSYKLAKIDSSSATKADTTSGITNSLNGGVCNENTYTGGCKIQTNNSGTGKKYVITQFGNMYGYNASSTNDAAGMTSTGDWRWDQTGSDGAHVYDQGPLIYSNSFSGTSGNESVSNSTYNVCTSSANGTTVYAVSANNTSGTLKDGNGNTVTYTTCKYANSATDADGRTSAADSGFAGNWYNWYAATAGSGTAEMTSGDAADSVCPRGWRLPGYDGDKSFQNLLVTSYALTTGSSLTNADTPLLSLPLSYIRSGYYNWRNAALEGHGLLNVVWANKTESATSAGHLMVNSTYILPQYHDHKGYSRPLRCVAR